MRTSEALDRLPAVPTCVCFGAQEEERATGRVDISIYHAYFAHWSRHFWLPILAVCICASARLDAVRLCLQSQPQASSVLI